MIGNLRVRALAGNASSSQVRTPVQRFAPLQKMAISVRSQPGDMKPQVDTPVQDSLADAARTAEKTVQNVASNANEFMNTSGEDIAALAIKAADDVTSGSDAVQSADDENAGEADKSKKPYSEQVLDGLDNKVDEKNSKAWGGN